LRYTVSARSGPFAVFLASFHPLASARALSSTPPPTFLYDDRSRGADGVLIALSFSPFAP